MFVVLVKNRRERGREARDKDPGPSIDIPIIFC